MARSIRLVPSVIAVVTLTVLPLQQLHAEDTFPYQATVSSEQALIYSGPSDDYYATARIAAGDTVEVYRHEDNGWCAIRPLPTSFSWVAAEHLEITDNPKLARIINVPVKTRVGSALSEHFDAEYISLRKGEVVELLGSEIRREAGKDAPSRWFKIAPPAGEFRFVHQRHLQATQAKEPSSKNAQDIEPMDIPTYSLEEPVSPALLPSDIADAEPLVTAANDTSEDTARTKQGATGFSTPVRQVSYETDGEASLPTKEQAAGDRSVTTDDPVVSESNSSAGQDIAAAATTSPSTAHVNAVTWEAVGRRTDLLSAPEPRTFVDRYNAMNIMLSRAILADIETWKLDKLQTQSERLLELADTVEHQELAQGLADKVLEFQSLQARARQVESDSSSPSEVSEPEKMAGKPASKPLPLPELPDEKQKDDAVQQASAVEMPRRLNTTPRPQTKIADLKNEKSIDNSIFDASGQLVLVKSRRTDIPKYALANSQGEIVQFIATKNGVNLTHLVNQEVGVLGKRGFLRALNKPFLMADRVLLLQR